MARHCFLINSDNDAIDPTVMALDSSSNPFKSDILNKPRDTSLI
jgi:hypothetical protein